MKNIIQFFKDNLVYIVILLLAFAFGAFKFLKRKPKDETANAKDILQGNGINANNSQFYVDTALSLAHNLGTAYSAFDPRSWSENDEKVFKALENVTRAQFDMIAKLYNQVYAKGKTLSNDLARLLDDEYYKLLKVK